MKIHPYLIFDGQCEEAIQFYKDILGGSISTQMRYGDAPADMPVSEEMKDKIMHMTLEFGEGLLMAADGMQGPLKLGNNAHMSLNVPVAEEAAAVFNSLAEDGQITMPFKEVFWGGKFGMLTDRYGVQWMVSSQHKPE